MHKSAQKGTGKKIKKSKKAKERQIEISFDQEADAAQEAAPEHRVNYWFLYLYILSVSLNGINVAWTNGGNNQTASVFAAKLDWTASETRLFNTLINFGSALGKAIGAIYGSRVIIMGRKKAFILFNVLSLLSTLMMQVLSVYTLVIGKLLSGTFTTVVHMAMLKHINETVPVHLLGKFGVWIQLGGSAGFALCFGLGYLLPAADYDPAITDSEANRAAYLADKQDVYWRFIYFFPVICNCIMLFNFLVFIRAESIMYSLRQGNDAEALILIKKVYHSSEDPQAILRTLKSQCHQQQEQKVPYWESLTGPKYLRGTLILMVYAALEQLSGVNCILMLSNRMVTVMNEGVEASKKIEANFATQLLGITAFFITMLSNWTVGSFKRKSLMVVGQIGMATSLGLTSFFASVKNGRLAVAGILSYFYTMLLSTVFWIYMPEVLNDNQLGVAVGAFYVLGVIVSILQEYIVEAIGVEGIFFIFASITFLGIFFLATFMEETKGLTDREKKELYCPKHLRTQTDKEKDQLAIPNRPSTFKNDVDVGANAGKDGSPGRVDSARTAEEVYIELEQQSQRSSVVEYVIDDDSNNSATPPDASRSTEDSEDTEV